MDGQKRRQVEQDGGHAAGDCSELPEPVREALADTVLIEGVRRAMAETEPPVPLRQLQAQERAARAKRHV